MVKCRELFLGIAIIFYIASLGYVLWHGLMQPVLNWDMVGYTGSVISLETKDPEVIYERTLAETRIVVTPGQYDYIAQTNKISNNSGSFNAWLPLDQLKILYVGFIWLMHRVSHGNIAQWTWFTSVFSFAILGATLAAWRPNAANRGIWLLSVTALSLIGTNSLQTLAALSTPDCFGLMFLMLAFVAWDQYGLRLAGAIFSWLAVLARPDNILVVLLMLTYFSQFAAPAKRLTYKFSLLIGLIAVTTYIAMFAMFGIGWNVFFYITFVDNSYDFTHMPVDVTWSLYQRALYSDFPKLITSGRTPFFAALSFMAVGCHYFIPSRRQSFAWLLLLSWSAFAIKFLSFPTFEERYYYSYYILILMACLELMAPACTFFGKRLFIHKDQNAAP